MRAPMVAPMLGLMLALALGLGGAGCGGGGSDGEGRTSRAERRAAPPADGYFRWRLREDPPNLDPAQASDTQSAAVLLRVNAGLVEFDPETLAVQPAVARSWTVSEDGRSYEFELRDDVRFHHDGRLVTAEDVDYSFHRVLRPEINSKRRWVFEQLVGAADFTAGRAERVAGIEVLSPHRIRLTLVKPFAPFLGLLCMEAASILPREWYEDPGRRYLHHPVGCGPFAFESWQRGNFLKLKAFDGYWRGRPRLNGITFRLIENMVTAVEEFRSGGLDLVDEVPPGQRRRLAEALPGQYITWPQLGVYYLGFNHQLPPFAGNRALRQAFVHAVNRNYICERLQEGKDVPAAGILPPGLPGHRPETVADPHDIELARRLLAEAGYPEGHGLDEIVLYFNTNEGHQRIAQQVQQDLAAIGVRIRLRNLDWGSYLDLIDGTPTENTTAAFFRLGWIADYPDPDNFLWVLLSRENWGPAGNNSRFHHPRFEELIQAARRTTDAEQRLALYHEAEQLAIDEAALLTIYYYRSEALLRPYVRDFRLSAQGDFAVPMHAVWFDGGTAPPS